MNIFTKKMILLQILIIALSCSSFKKTENTIVNISTSLGDIKIKLYDDTPIHRDNFINLVKSGFYDGISFHRVIKDFMIQAGNLETRTSTENLPDSLKKNYTIPAEIVSQHFHKRGAVAAARQGDMINPKKRSSGTQFYIVQGTVYNDEKLEATEKQINNGHKQQIFNKLFMATADSVRLSGSTINNSEIQEMASMKMFKYLANHEDYKITDSQKEVYKSIGGVPWLDSNYTVFGEVIDGMDVVDSIASVETDSGDKPLEDVKIIKVKITRK